MHGILLGLLRPAVGEQIILAVSDCAAGGVFAAVVASAAVDADGPVRSLTAVAFASAVVHLPTAVDAWAGVAAVSPCILAVSHRAACGVLAAIVVFAAADIDRLVGSPTAVVSAVAAPAAVVVASSVALNVSDRWWCFRCRRQLCRGGR